MSSWRNGLLFLLVFVVFVVNFIFTIVLATKDQAALVFVHISMSMILLWLMGDLLGKQTKKKKEG